MQGRWYHTSVCGSCESRRTHLTDPRPAPSAQTSGVHLWVREAQASDCSIVGCPSALIWWSSTEALIEIAVKTLRGGARGHRQFVNAFRQGPNHAGFKTIKSWMESSQRPLWSCLPLKATSSPGQRVQRDSGRPRARKPFDVEKMFVRNMSS